MESPSSEWNADETQTKQEEVEARPDNACRDNGCSNDGRNSTTNTIATMSGTKNRARWLDVGAEDVVQSQTGCRAISYAEEAVQL